MQLNKADERGRNEDFVGQGVHEPAEIAFQMTAAGDFPVQQIGKARGDKDGEGDGVRIGQAGKKSRHEDKA